MSSDRIVRSVEVKAPIERVWRAVTDHREFGQWFRVRIEQPFVLGGASTGNITYPGYEHIKWDAEVTRLEPPHHFAFTWPHPVHPEGDPRPQPRTLVEFHLEAIATGTRVTVTESGFDALPPGPREKRLRDNTGGWEEQMGNIRAHVDG